MNINIQIIKNKTYIKSHGNIPFPVQLNRIKAFPKLSDRLCFYLFTAQCIQNMNAPPCKRSRLFTAEICMTRPLEENGSSFLDLAEIDLLDASAHSGGTRRA